MVRERCWSRLKKPLKTERRNGPWNWLIAGDAEPAAAQREKINAPTRNNYLLSARELEDIE